MSRHVLHNGKNKFAYGFDLICGYFYQVYVAGVEEPVEDKDNLTPGFHRVNVVERAKELGFNMPSEHIDQIMLDLPIGD